MNDYWKLLCKFVIQVSGKIELKIKELIKKNLSNSLFFYYLLHKIAQSIEVLETNKLNTILIQN